MAERKRVYCMDLGTGTIDILYRDDAKLADNQTRIVAPSPALVHMDQVYEAGEVLRVDGWVVGGGPFAKALKKRAAAGKRTVLSTACSAIVKNDPKIVTDAGIEISDEVPEGADRIHADELRLEDHREILRRLGERPPEGWAVAVQDHGGSDDGLPDRVHRFSEFRDQLGPVTRLEDFAFTAGQVPAPFRRMTTAARYMDELGGGLPYIVMDTVFAGLLGCIASRPVGDETVLAVNLGNSHTTAAAVREGRVLALFEHHTKHFKKDPDRLVERLGQFLAGVLTEQGVRDDGGCGVWYLEPGKPIEVAEARCSGPRRRVLAGRTLPGGTRAEAAFADVDAMMVGPLGLAAAWDRIHGA